MFCVLMNTVGSRGGGDIFLDICRLCCGGGEQEQRQCGDTSRNFNCMGTGCDGAGLLNWSHLWCPFQSCCHHCFCLHQKVSLEAGDPNTPCYLYNFHNYLLNYRKVDVPKKKKKKKNPTIEGQTSLSFNSTLCLKLSYLFLAYMSSLFSFHISI